MSINSAPYPDTHLRLGKRLAKYVLHGLHKLLPHSAYQAIYVPTFRFYHSLQRKSYGKKVRRLENQGDEAALLCARRVYSVMPYSLVGVSGLEHTHDLALDVTERKIPGAFVECGVARGGCAALMGMVAANDSSERPSWFFDSYEGLPDPTSKDYSNGRTGDHIRPLSRGSCLGTYEEVSKLLFEKMELSREQITMVKGWFQDTLPEAAHRIGPIALLRIDGDWHDSTRCCLEYLYDQVSPSGYVIIDDYYSCYGARRATDDFLVERGIKTVIVADGRGGCSFQKPATLGLLSTQHRQAAA